MPGTPLASLQLGRVARSSQQMLAFGPFADALEARCVGLLLAGSRGSRCSPIAVGRLYWTDRRRAPLWRRPPQAGTGHNRPHGITALSSRSNF